MTHTPRTYLALGDSMSIDYYTGVVGGGAVNQFYKTLGSDWKLTDRTFDGATMPEVYRMVEESVDLITLTIGGNDLLINQERYLSGGLDSFGDEHQALLQSIRQMNPAARFIVGNIYAPQLPLNGRQIHALNEANRLIADNTKLVNGALADIHGAFGGNEQQFLCLNIEPTLEGAKAISDLFQEAFERSL